MFFDTESTVYDFYPASGYRADNIGDLLDAGTRGCTWSNSPNSNAGVGGSFLRFTSTSLFPEDYSGRATGFTVRCVQLRLRREQRPFTGYAEPQRSGAPKGGVKGY